MKIAKIAVIVISFIILSINFTGCSNAILQIGKNKYTTTAATRTGAYSDAANFCKEKGLDLKPTREGGSGGSSRSLDFKCLDSNSEEYQKDTKYQLDSDISIKSDIKVENK